MSRLCRTLVVAAAVLPAGVAAPAVALADDGPPAGVGSVGSGECSAPRADGDAPAVDGGGLAHELWSGVEQGQSNRTDQRNVNVAPVVQVAPTIDADGLLGQDGGDVRPDNRIDNRTIQENRNETVQHQFGCTRGG